MKLDEFPRHPLAFGPSPVHHLERLSDHLAAQGWESAQGFHFGAPAPEGGSVRQALQLRHDPLDGAARRELHDDEGHEQDAEHGRHHEQHAARDIAEHVSPSP